MDASCVCGFLCIIGSVSLSSCVFEECIGVSLCTFWYLAVSTYFIAYGTVCPVTKENVTNILVS